MSLDRACACGLRHIAAEDKMSTLNMLRRDEQNVLPDIHIPFSIAFVPYTMRY
jgi:hypothetical protein